MWSLPDYPGELTAQHTYLGTTPAVSGYFIRGSRILRPQTSDLRPKNLDTLKSGQLRPHKKLKSD